MADIKKRVFVDLRPVVEDEKSLVKYVCTERSDGKTTGALALAYDTQKKEHKTPVFCRRWVGDISKTYLQTCVTNLAKVRPVDRDKITFDGEARRGVLMREDEKPLILFGALSAADGLKSSLDFETHKNLIIDEYDPLNGRYLKDEADIITEIWRTIDRDNSITDIKNYVLILSNKVRASNPILRAYNAYPSNGLTRWQNGRFLALMWRNKANEERLRGSPLDDLTAGTSYNDYIYGEALRGCGNFIQRTHTRERVGLCVVNDGVKYCPYLSDGGAVVFDYADAYAAANLPCFGLTTAEGLPTIWTATNALKTLINRAGRGLVRFASERVFEDLKPLFKILF